VTTPSRARDQARPDGWWQLRIELLDVTPTVWRRVKVPETIRLPTLHRVLQASLGWTNSHLHEFVINGVRYGIPDPDWDSKQRDERNVVLHRALGREARSFDYVYDFGDDWHHVVVLEDPWVRGDPSTTVSCIAGANACPPEDVGGPHGYSEFLSALADPEHEEHENYSRWVGGSFDPARFDIAASNLTLAKISAPKSMRP
jgi:hypothetical protein